MTVTCPKCLVDGSHVTVDLDDGDTLRCQDCEEQYTVAEIEAIVVSWSKLLPWLKAHPSRQMTCEAVT